MRFFIGFLLGLSVGTVFAFPILIWMATLVATLFRFIGLPNESTYPQILIPFVIVYSVFAACSIRLAKIAHADSLLLGFLLAFPVVSLGILAALTIGEQAID
ncbi:hypothetical protein A1351_18550 [Methylosinus sp. R-45379]|uniref:hypothetical protein n=1 Tax=unclassified Methylosinus TaxID=2624500 RepID=UPI0004654FA0|nr:MULTISPECIES: hypothetical protein [unclassified Methylosinus]OAI24006.1 hypothetical protein A1351_18550 [Methylosinus sp. R-45379]TDX65711.1 hypothetical protein EDE12_102199 [Methylosinus sp. sav-2]